VIADEPLNAITAPSDLAHSSRIVQSKNCLLILNRVRFGEPPRPTREPRVLPRIFFAVTRSADTTTLDETAPAFFIRSSRCLLHLCDIDACTTISGRTGG
jgi:hypothetical protein